MTHVPSVAFAKNVSSVFIVGSPFQLLCSIEAMMEFEMETAYFVLVLTPGMARNEQLYSMMRDMGLAYDEINGSLISYHDFLRHEGLFSQRENKPKFERVVICDPFYVDKKMVATMYAAENASLFYTDDGNSSIFFLNQSKWQLLRLTAKIQLKKMLSLIGLFPQTRSQLLCEKQISRNPLFRENNLFTIYADIPYRQATLYPNRLKHLSSKMGNGDLDKMILFIGTVSNQFSRQVNISESRFLDILEQKFCEIRNHYPHIPVLYIPHGRDVNPTIPTLCEKHQITYKRITSALEYFVIKNQLRPIHIYGFNSTALLTLKYLSPASSVTNYKIENSRMTSFYKSFFNTISSYYVNKNIEENVICVNDL